MQLKIFSVLSPNTFFIMDGLLRGLLRAASSHLQWTFAGLSFIFFSISLLKYTRISPALGAYVSGVFRIFLIDIPRFFVIVIIVLIAYIGGIHLAARQQPSSNQSLCSVDPYQVCNNSLSQFFWFNQELTCAYDLRRPLLSGLIFMLDGGPGNHVEDILQDNLFFTLIYLTFSFTIIVVLLNILIAQLSETYSSIIKENNSHYKIALVVTLELKSNLAFWFGKRFRKYTSIKSLTIPGAHWYQLIKGEWCVSEFIVHVSMVLSPLWYSRLLRLIDYTTLVTLVTSVSTLFAGNLLHGHRSISIVAIFL